jgi:hypothetical protein
MVRDASSFSEGVTGPTPDEALMEVTRDDPGGLSYVLIERRVGAEIGRASYQLSFAGSPSRILVDGRTTAVSATRSPTGDVTVNAPPKDGYWAVIRIKRTGPESVVVEHAVDSASGEIPLESVAMIRASPSVTVAPLAPGH